MHKTASLKDHNLAIGLSLVARKSKNGNEYQYTADIEFSHDGEGTAV